jgi:hypothetical protein
MAVLGQQLNGESSPSSHKETSRNGYAEREQERMAFETVAALIIFAAIMIVWAFAPAAARIPTPRPHNPATTVTVRVPKIVALPEAA